MVKDQVNPNEPEQKRNQIMRTKTYHISNLGSFAPGGLADSSGFVTYHDSERYGKATDAQLEEWSESSRAAVRAAALTEQAERRLEQWRKK